MGADLIGYMVRGPNTIDEPAEAAAVEAAVTRLADLRECARLLEAYDDLQDADPKPPVSQILDEAQVLRDLEQAMLKIPMYTTHTTPESCRTVLENWDWLLTGYGDSRDDVVNLLREFCDMWNHNTGPRDCVKRTFHDSNGVPFQVVFCGEMSWGDEPSGYGYQLLHAVEALDLYGVLGLS